VPPSYATLTGAAVKITAAPIVVAALGDEVLQTATIEEGHHHPLPHLGPVRPRLASSCSDLAGCSQVSGIKGGDAANVC